MSETKKCPKCGETKLLSEFYKGGQRRCAECQRSDSREWNKTNVDRKREFNKRRTLLRKYGLSLSDRAEILRLQSCRCVICTDPLTPGTKGHAIDHCHVSGKVRGILCQACNTGLARFKDDPAIIREAAAYLERHKKS